jgi:hypothetical protein
VSPQVVGEECRLPVGVGLADLLAQFVVGVGLHVSARRGDGVQPPQQVIAVLGRVIEPVRHPRPPPQRIVHRDGGRAVRVLCLILPPVQVIDVSSLIFGTA